MEEEEGKEGLMDDEGPRKGTKNEAKGGEVAGRDAIRVKQRRSVRNSRGNR
jgi:hypothetical protein